jgi:hypothetical protein
MTTANLLGRILGQLGQVRIRCPELRFGQMLATIGMLAEDESGHSLWDVEDADFAAALERFAEDMACRGSDGYVDQITELKAETNSYRAAKRKEPAGKSKKSAPGKRKTVHKGQKA